MTSEVYTNMSIFISSPCKGGLFRLDNHLGLASLRQGNIRGLCYFEGKLCHVNGDENAVFCGDNKIITFDGVSSLHDVKFCDGHFYVMATEFRRLIKFNTNGDVVGQVQFDSNYWPNCCIPFENKIVVFLSAKRPFSNSKIVCFREDWSIDWEYCCFEGDEIHSPFLVGNVLYWCRSNRNCVVCGGIKEHLEDAKKVLVDDSGYTRGLCIDGHDLYLGTSENRHAKTSLCNSMIDSGSIRHYVESDGRYVLKETVILPVKEVYDIVYDQNIN